MEYGICMNCLGRGLVRADQMAINRKHKTIKAPYTDVTCPKCNGTGSIKQTGGK